MNKKLKRYLDETEKTKEKISQLQEHLRNVQAMQKQDEDMEIIKSIRGMKLPPRELFELLCGLQEGSLVIAKVRCRIKWIWIRRKKKWCRKHQKVRI